jgi:mannose/fructose/N-acetylgalactosamine-specific phosphotransferase system component IIC
MAERFGARRGSVSDIFLPDFVARNLTWSGSIILAIGIALNVRALRGQRRAG